MGVMNCSRRGCENIMCDTYIPEVGYVCTSCQSDFEQHMSAKHGMDSMNQAIIIDELKSYMETEKRYTIDKDTSISDFFNDHTS